MIVRGSVRNPRSRSLRPLFISLRRRLQQPCLRPGQQAPASLSERVNRHGHAETDRGHHDEPRQRVHGSGHPRPHRQGGRPSARATLPRPRQRHQAHRAASVHPWRRRRHTLRNRAPGPQHECDRGAVRGLHQARVSQSARAARDGPPPPRRPQNAPGTTMASARTRASAIGRSLDRPRPARAMWSPTSASTDSFATTNARLDADRGEKKEEQVGWRLEISPPICPERLSLGWRALRNCGVSQWRSPTRRFHVG